MFWSFEISENWTVKTYRIQSSGVWDTVAGVLVFCDSFPIWIVSDLVLNLLGGTSALRKRRSVLILLRHKNINYIEICIFVERFLLTTLCFEDFFENHFNIERAVLLQKL